MSDLDRLRDRIENMSFDNQLKVLRIVRNCPTLTENRSGVMLNLALQSDQIIKELTDFVNYVEASEKMLASTEKARSDLIAEYFSDTADPKRV